jgi:hypothetical protein
MGGGSYSYSNSVTYRASKGWASEDLLRSNSIDVPDGYVSASSADIFRSRSINNAMNPHGITVRESRDSEEHPNSLAIIIGLDVTGSMGSVPHHLVKEGLPELMKQVLDAGVEDPQVLFLGIGDHECDRAPLQVGQFESSDELLDKWLTDTYLEGGGGGNAGESYALAWYFAARHTSIDCFEKRQKKGFIFTIGDEPVLHEYPKSALQRLMGPGQYENFTADQLLKAASEKYEVFHIHIRETTSGSRTDRIPGWKQLIQDHLLVAERHEDVPDLIAKTIVQYTKQSVPEAKVTTRIESTKTENML